MDDKETARWVRQEGRMYEYCPACGYAKKIFYSWRFCPACGRRLEGYK